MRGRRSLFGFIAALVVAGTAAAVLGSLQEHTSSASAATRPWATKNLPGNVRLTGQVPLAVAQIPGAARKASPAQAGYVRHHAPTAELGLNFAFPLRDKAGLDRLIAQEAKTHHYLTRAELYARFAPPAAQVDALRSWLVGRGFRITHVGADRMAITAYAPTVVVEKTLHVKINDYLKPASSFGKLKLSPYQFYSNTKAPLVPARFGVQSISGLSDIDRFFTSVQLATGKINSTPSGADCGDDDNAVVNPLCTDVRSGGYFPSDLKGLYDITGHGIDGTGQTVGFTLWTAAERQTAMTAYATNTGDTPITVDPSCVATGNSATTPSSCSAAHVAPNHLMTILENGNTDANNNFNSNVETALDIEAAHAVANGVAMKYYAAECASSTPPGSGLTNAGCNGSDTGLLDAIEDAASDPTLHSVSNSWAFGGDAEWGAADPFLMASENSFQLAAAAGTTFYFSTGDSGGYQSGYPSDSAYVVAVGGTSTYSTSSSSTYSTTTTWSGGGSWCSNVIARPSWQTGPGVAANAPCPGRVIPDVSAVADPTTGLRFTDSTNLTGGTQSGQVGGTSLAAPVMNGLQALTQNFIAAQTFSGPTPPMGFTAPVMYQMGNSGHYSSYFRDVTCGNTANPTSGPDGDAATAGWDAATGWGEPDWFNFSVGYALQLGATNLSVPPSLAPRFPWTCAKTPSNSAERGFSFPTTNVGYAVGAASGGTPWYGKFLPANAWGAVNTFFKTTDGGLTWFPSNSDMFSIACTSGSTCLEVGAGRRERRTTDSGSTWSDVATAPNNNKPLTQVTCPSGSICYAVGDRGNAMKSTDGGSTWSWLDTGDGNPIYGLSCPSTSVCYATDIYAWVYKTADGGAHWTRQQTPITTPGLDVPGSGGPNPFAGLMAISCSDPSTCVASGLYVVASGQTIPSTDPPIITTTDGGATWVRQTSNSGVTGTAPNYLHSISCLPGTQTCTAVGRGGSIVTTTNLSTWTKVASGTTNMLNSVTCLSTSFCMAAGQNGTIDVFNGAAWAATTGNGGTGMLASVTCVSTSTCYATGKQGVTIATTNGGGSWTVQAGGGTTAQMNSISCSSATTCYAVGAAVGGAATILKTSNGGQTWLPQTSGTGSGLNGVACTSATTCVAVGAAGTARITTDGATWSAGTTGTTQALNGVSCSSAAACVAVGAAGTALTSSNAGSTWSPGTSGATVALNAVACPSATCFAAGAATGGSAVVLKSTDNGATWLAQTSNTPNALSGIACISDSYCFADGTIGTVMATTDGGTTWVQQGNPLSGPTTALNVTNVAGLSLLGVACNPGRCVIGTGTQGDIMTTGLLTVAADSQSRLFGSANPPLTATITGFAPGDSAASAVTGSASCTTTAQTFSTGGDYPITCTLGNLTAANYNFAYFVPGTLTVTYTHPCLTGSQGGKLNVAAGEAICVGAGAVQNGQVNVAAGGRLDVEGGTIVGPVKSTGAVVVRLCGANVQGPLTVTGSTGLVLVGGDAATGACAANTLVGPVSVTGNTGGVEFNGNPVTGPLTITGNTGSLPAPDTGSVHAVGNTVSGPSKIQP